jgi:vacuolar protein sorting-associated protein 13B
VGSLDLIGSPTGLARTVGDGLRDLVALPARGLMRGPAALAGGLVSGSASLAKHVGAGAIASVATFAGSVSRNMDRLSLDAEHTRRNELLRR